LLLAAFVYLMADEAAADCAYGAADKGASGGTTRLMADNGSCSCSYRAANDGAFLSCGATNNRDRKQERNGQESEIPFHFAPLLSEDSSWGLFSCLR
jgi:hypothetical protein